MKTEKRIMLKASLPQPVICRDSINSDLLVRFWQRKLKRKGTVSIKKFGVRIFIFSTPYGEVTITSRR